MLLETLLPQEVTGAWELPQELESFGYDGMWMGESAHDPFLQCLAAARVTTTATLGTAIVVAFARSPMTTALAAYDLAQYSGGRFILGLGTQIKPHIVRRFSMPWSHPVDRVRDYVSATRAIWHSWQHGAPLDHRGDFYHHTLMTPVFTPKPHEWGPPPIYLAGFGDRMVRLAGEVADGFLVHPFHSAATLRERTLPALANGSRLSGRAPTDVQIAPTTLVATGHDGRQIDHARRRVRRWLSFYTSTPAYRGTLEHHGYGHLHEPFKSMSKQGRWDEMTELFPADLVDEIAIVGPIDEVGDRLRDKYAGLVTRLCLHLPDDPDPQIHRDVLRRARIAFES